MTESGLDLKTDLIFLLNNPTFHDTAIACADGIEVKACGAFLAARSTVFMQKLFGPEPSANVPTKRIVLDNINSTTLKIIIHYIHTETIGTTTLSSESAMEAYLAAIFFRLPKLSRMVLDHLKNIEDLAVTSKLLNDTAASMTPNEANIDVFNILLNPFRKRTLVMGDLNSLSEKALELLLTQSPSNSNMAFNTPEHQLLICVVDWAWSRSQDAPTDVERRARLWLLEDVKEPYEEPGSDAKVCFVGNALVRMMHYMDLMLVCPHRLRLIMGTIDALSYNSPQHVALSNHACAGAKCSQGHPSGTRGKPTQGHPPATQEMPTPKKLEWDRSRIGTGLVVTEDGTVIEFPKGLQGLYRTARVSNPFTMAETELCEWDIVIESTSTSSPFNDVGLVAEAFNSFDDHTIHSTPSWTFIADNSKYYRLFVNGSMINQSYGKSIKIGDVVTFHLNMTNRTCSLSINGHNYGVAWRDLPDKIYPAVSFRPGAKYRIRSRTV